MPGGELKVTSKEKEIKQSTETKKSVKEFPKLFEGNGKVQIYPGTEEIQAGCKNNAAKREKNPFSKFSYKKQQMRKLADCYKKAKLEKSTK